MEHKTILFVDLEVTETTRKIHEVGARMLDQAYRGTSITPLNELYYKYRPSFICGHNLIRHDQVFLSETSFNPILGKLEIIDTLFLSILLFPTKLSHKLEKHYKSEIHLENNPLGDCEATESFLHLLMEKYNSMSSEIQAAIVKLLSNAPHFSGFFKYINASAKEVDFQNLFSPHVFCSAEILSAHLKNSPVEMAILLSYFVTEEKTSISSIVLRSYPEIVNILKELRDNKKVDLLDFSANEFGIKDFRSFEIRDANKDLFSDQKKKISQRDIVNATLKGESLLAILPTGGGKTFTFQLPALIKAQAYKGLTIVISPLQALMKNHVDSFKEKNQNFKVAAISGYLSPVERLNTIAEIESGVIDILYLAPEALRSNSIFNVLKKRIIERFVIDEAHCFSSWGHDFRHDYKFIANFIKQLQEDSPWQGKIPVSCFTATAKPEVLDDIKTYLKNKLNLDLSEFFASSKRNNLFYKAIEVETDTEKYEKLLAEITRLGRVPTIIYLPQNARGCKDLAQKLYDDARIIEMGLEIEPFYSKIDEDIELGKRSGRNKTEILNDFITDKIDIVIATTAFGMGIDKPNIQAVIHYETSDSLESFMQESGRGGRSENISAECIVLFSNNDFDKLFYQQNRSKIEYDEIKKILVILKKEKRNPAILSAKQISELAGLDYEDTSKDYETLIKTAILELEEAGVLERGRNATKIYATSITGASGSRMDYVHQQLDPDKDKLGELYDEMIRVMALLVARSKLNPIITEDLSDLAGINRNKIHNILKKLADYELISMGNDISVSLKKTVKKQLSERLSVEDKILNYIYENPHGFNLRELNVLFTDSKNNITISKKIIQNFKNAALIAKKKFSVKFKGENCIISELDEITTLKKLFEKRKRISGNILDALLTISEANDYEEIEFSSIKLKKDVADEISIEGFHHILAYMHEILNDFKLLRGRLIYYQGFELRKTDKAAERTPYKKPDYKRGLKSYYERKTESIHILLEYFKRLVKLGWERCVQFISDYFAMDYIGFKKAYGFNTELCKIPLTENSYKKIISDLNEEQNRIFEDKDSSKILVLAGPGSGKTKTLVHKIASLITLEGHKPEYFLMLTHGRSAAHEFRSRLVKLIGDIGYAVEIMTFHAFAFQLLGKRSSDSQDLKEIVDLATNRIIQGEISIPYKTMLLLDEFQDISQKTYRFIQAIICRLEGSRKVIAIGDDDQCINNFDGDDGADITLISRFESEISKEAYKMLGDENEPSEEEDKIQENCVSYSLLNNYRSYSNIVEFSNAFAELIPSRLKNNALISKKPGTGFIQINNYGLGSDSITGVIEAIKNDHSENIVILCKTNQEVLTVYSALIAQGINAKYLTSKNGFNLGQLVELQDFLTNFKMLSFNEALERLKNKYAKSSNLNLALKIIDRFIEEYCEQGADSKHLIKVFEDYLYTIEFDEFDYTRSKIVVSTMHKAKGKEFESVYVLFDNGFFSNEYDYRLAYVAITRAKSNLYIHINNPLFKQFEYLANEVNDINILNCSPNKIIFQMGLEDVWLGSNKAAEGIKSTAPVAGEIVKIKKKMLSETTIFEISKNEKIIAILAKEKAQKKVLSEKILASERKGYVLNCDAAIEFVIRKKLVTGQIYDQILCQVTMDKK